MPEDISKIETNNLKDAEKKRKILDWTELYNSTLVNIQDATNKLSGIFAQIEIKQKELDSKNKELWKISEVYRQNQLVLDDIQLRIIEKRQILTEKQTVFELRKKNLLLEIKQKSDALDHKGFETNVKIKIAKDNLVKLEQLITEKKSESSKLTTEKNRIKNEIISLKNKERKIKDNLIKMDKYQVDFIKNNTLLIKQREKIEADIYKKQRSLDSFKENKKTMEQDSKRKTKDLQILEGRLRKQFKTIGQDFKL